VIFQAFKRQVGAREAARSVRGLLCSAAEAERIGLVEEVVPAERVVERAVEWCQSVLALPRQAMLATRAQSRADLIGLFSEGVEREIDGVVEMWWSPEVQSALHSFVEKLKKRK
jgi:enoyl-CoA hydratase/carnithine racemase